jgi:thioredoxin-like negative regulator of GroEL
VEAHFNLGLVLQLVGRPAEARRHLAAVVQERPEMAGAIALIEQGRLKEARQYLEHTLAVERRNQGALFLYARLLLDLGEDPEKVKDIVDEIRSGFPKSREKIEAYFEQASKGRIRFEEGGVY